ncbi:hypothetical protein J421_4434 [Gemmatirosa kalamazoonensis]|uniref:Thrombospondin type 3 repeat-containing protein n=1 Tax=Gemmatirosa kalamazoonensis TaxID=861299 RepID=W0RMH2_9BACT|nr:hypothetical protein [Gemmatirosa kalamazoonensis]AHG91971.1 hypothetical protein J421_4434 [Gemmatirosa kalamazoonensis]
MIRSLLLFMAALALEPTFSSATAQVRLPKQPPYRQLGPAKSEPDSQSIPAAYRPPPGMCRIWLENVPPSQQPASTDCVTAVRNRPNNARVIFGDDYVEKGSRGKDKGRDKKPESHVDAGDMHLAEPMDALVAPRGGLALALAPRVHGPQAGDALDLSGATDPALDARPLDAPGVVVSDQPPARRRTERPTTRRATPRDTMARRDTLDERERAWREPDLRGRRDSSLSEQRRALRDRLRGRDSRDARDGRDARDDRDDDWDDARDRRGADRRDARGADAGYGAGYGPGYGAGYGAGYGPGYYPPYPPPARSNGVCLDRDRDGWCDDVRTGSGSGYCLDRDGDGRCDDYSDLAAAPYSSSMPPMRAAMDVQRGAGSQLALRWLGTAEVMVRTTDLKRTGTPYRAMWLDANTGRLLQVWTDRDGDGIADRVEIYRNGRVAKILGR